MSKLKINTKGLLVDTPNGKQNFKGIKKSVHNICYEITFFNGIVLKCTVNHIFDTISGPILAKDLTSEEVNTKDGITFVKSKKLIKGRFVAFDLISVEGGNLYYTNGIVSHNCSFIGSSSTLVSGSKISQLVYLDPIVEKDSIQIYEQPKNCHVYVALIDVSEGIGSDYSIINIIDVTQSPYKQVFLYRSNTTDPFEFGPIIETIGKKYNYAHVVVEYNNDGKTVANYLKTEDYENLVTTETVKSEIVTKRGRKSRPGILMTTSVKREGCTRLRNLIESDILQVVNDHTISEIGTFIKVGNTYQADKQKNDDCVMTLVMFSWFTSTSYFEDISGINGNKQIIESKDDDVYDLLGFVEDGDYESSIDDSFDLFGSGGVESINDYSEYYAEDTNSFFL